MFMSNTCGYFKNEEYRTQNAEYSIQNSDSGITDSSVYLWACTISSGQFVSSYFTQTSVSVLWVWPYSIMSVKLLVYKDDNTTGNF